MYRLRVVRMALSITVALGVIIADGGLATADVVLCSTNNVSTTSGTVACDGGTQPLTATATIRNAVRLTLVEMFGRAATSLEAPFGGVDAMCAGTAPEGVSCVEDTPANAATWYGAVRFAVTMGGASNLLGGASTARLTGTRNVGGTVPLGRLLDGAAGIVPTVAYQPIVPITLKTGIPNGHTVVTRTLGLRVTADDAPGAWTTSAAYSVVIE